MEDQFLDFVLNRKIKAVATDAAQARRDSRGTKNSIRELEEQVGRLTLACTAMWELLRDRVGVTDEELIAHIEEVDLRDGKLDGQHTSEPLACSGCGRINSSSRRFCMFCEAPLKSHALR